MKGVPAYRSAHQIELMEENAILLRQILEGLGKSLSRGMRASSLDALAASELKKCGFGPGTRGYRGFPACVSVNINAVAAHGIPGEQIFLDGDIVTIDMAAQRKGFWADVAWTFQVGDPSPSREALLACAWDASMEAARAAILTRKTREIGNRVQALVRERGFQVMPRFGGHGIGRELHEAPRFSFMGLGDGEEIPAGSVINVEPIISSGSGGATLMPDGSWQAEDDALCAQFEHSVLLLPGGEGRILGLELM